MPAPTLAYWGIRGLANPIRQLLEHVGEKYDFKDYNAAPEPGWLGEKHNLGLEFPNLPYYIDGNVKMSQSGAIIRYLARKHKLVAKNDEDLIKQDVIDGLMGDFRMGWAWLVYFSENMEKDKPKYLERVGGVLKEFDAKLAKQEYVLGNYLTYNDFVFFEILDINEHLFGAEFLKSYPNLIKYHERIGNLKGVKEYMSSDRNPKKINGPMAKWGG